MYNSGSVLLSTPINPNSSGRAPVITETPEERSRRHRQIVDVVKLKQYKNEKFEQLRVFLENCDDSKINKVILKRLLDVHSGFHPRSTQANSRSHTLPTPPTDAMLVLLTHETLRRACDALRPTESENDLS